MNMAGRVNAIVTQYLGLVQYPRTLFNCCEDPQVVCVDGIVLSVEAKRLRHQETPWRNTNALKTRFTNRKQRSLILFNAAQRELVKLLMGEGLLEVDMCKLDDDFEDHPVMVYLLSNVVQHQNDPCLFVVPLILREFVHCITKDIVPASSLAPYGTWKVLKDILATQIATMNHRSVLAKLSPIINQVVTHITQVAACQESTARAMKLLGYIIERAEACFVPQFRSYSNPITYVAPDERQQYPNPFIEAVETGAFFPSMPYHSVVRDINFGKETTNCTKEYKQSGRLGAGTLLFWCGIHRKCIGFYMLPSAESCQHVYTILLSRFKRMPRVVIYDNGCNLNEYVLNRAPEPFKGSYILSDGFHWKNHVNCASTFNSKLYSDLNGMLL